MKSKNELKKGVAINFITKYTNVIIQIILGAILSRLLTPKEFGVVAIVQVFITFFNMLSEAGIGPAIIQNKELTKEDNSSIFIFTIFLGIIFGGLFFSLGGFISNFYKNFEYIKIVRFLSISILFFTINIVPLALNMKKLKFKTVGIINVLVSVFGGLISITLAYRGFSYYSIIYGSIIRSFLIFLFNMYSSGLKVIMKFKICSIRKVFNYSAFQFLFNFINYFSRNLDNILIGKYMGNSALGFYDKAYKLMLYPVGNLTGVISPILHPILSRYQNDKKEIYYNYLRITKALALLGIPISVFLYFTSKEIILIMYGKQWVESINIFRILSCTVWIQVILSSSGAIFQAAGNTKMLFLSGLLSSITMCSGIIYGISTNDLNKIGIGLILAFSINFFQGFYVLIKLVLKESYIEFLINLLKPVIIGIIMIFTYKIITYEVKMLFLNFIIKGSIGCLGYLIGLVLTKEYKVLINIFKEK